MMRWILLLLLPAVLASPVCQEPIGNPLVDYMCHPPESFPCTGPNCFEQACFDDFNGAIIDSNHPTCIQECCCLDGDSVGDTATVSQWKCNQVGGEHNPAATDCSAVCGESPGGTSQSFTVSGLVTDTASGQPIEAAVVSYAAGSVQRATNTEGSYQLTIPEGNARRLRAAKSGCGFQELSVDVTADTQLDFQLDCSGGGCTPTGAAATKATPNQGRDTVAISWTADTCSQVQGYAIYRCVADVNGCAGELQPRGVSQQQSFVDTNVPAGTRLCYHVKAVLEDGTELDQVESTEHCVAPMSEYCMQDGPLGVACFNRNPLVTPPLPDGSGTYDPFIGSAHCTNTNQLTVVESCQAGELCTNSIGGPRCGRTDQCEQCNGPLGFFVDPLAEFNSQQCRQLAGCTLNNEGFAVNTFESCIGVTSCYDYRTEAACVQQDACAVADGPCQWEPVPGMEELGKGVCAPTTPTPGISRCRDCSDIFGFCNTELCSAMGDCYYNEQSTFGANEPIGCLGIDEMACSFYDDAQSCSAGSDVQVDVSYTGNERTGGSHQVTPSNDLLDFGRCSWTGSNCIKDSNGLVTTTSTFSQGADDCLETNPSNLLECLQDTEPPTTIMPLWSGQSVNLTRLRNTIPIVNDNVFSSGFTTYGCLAPGDGTCYPTKPFDQLFTNISTPTATLHFYSVDPAGNLERVQRLQLVVNKDSTAYLLRAVLI